MATMIFVEEINSKVIFKGLTGFVQTDRWKQWHKKGIQGQRVE